MRKNVAGQYVDFQLVSTSDGSDVTSGTTTVYVAIDGGAQGAGSGSVSHKGNGAWEYIPTQAETNGSHVAFTAVNSSAVSQTVNVYPIPLGPLDSLATGTVVSATSTTTLLDSGSVATANYYVGSRLRIISGTGANQERIIEDYTATRLATHAEWSTTPDATSVYTIEQARTSLATPDGTTLVFTGAAGESEVSICNMALSHLGVAKEIANLETESSQEAAACRRFFVEARDNTLRDYPWPFATKIADLALVEEDPNDEWQYSYRMPSDALRLNRILSGLRNDNAQSRVPYRVVRDDVGLLIYTDQEDAEIEYVMRETDPTRYPADFRMALSLRLAAYIAPRLTAGDPYKLGDRALNLHRLEIQKAEASAVNEEQAEQLPDSEFMRERE